ncbi:copper fist DNA binding domain-containing protein [Phycomyces nitens]|nr:copper fist DNA binding domain-containing protein [Phycomyces nitens]
MILIDNIKHACASCIKGHRSSSCQHKDRHLLPIRRKGRPISQCDQCREERKKRRVHQKCSCSSKKDPLIMAPTSRQMMSIQALLL